MITKMKGYQKDLWKETGYAFPLNLSFYANLTFITGKTPLSQNKQTPSLTLNEHIWINADILSNLISLCLTWELQFLGTVRTVNVSIVRNKVLFRQVETAFLAVKTVIVPRATLVVHHIGSLSKSCWMRKSRFICHLSSKCAAL